SSVVRHRHCGSSTRRRLPDLPPVRPVRAEIDPLAIVRPGGQYVARTLACYPPGRSALFGNYIDVRILPGAGIECNPLAVRRPARAAGRRPGHGGERKWVRSVARRQPDLLAARPVAHESDLGAIR